MSSGGRMSKIDSGGPTRMGKMSKDKCAVGRTEGNEANETELPLEKRYVDFKLDSGVSSKVSALHKKWVEGEDSTKWIEFWIPKTEELQDSSVVKTWAQYMQDVLIPDLQWLLSLPHHRFWSVMVHVKALGQDVLYSFRVRAPRFYDPGYHLLESHEIVWPIYKTIYVLMFRVFMRLSTFKESSENHISPSFWSQLLHDHDLINMRTIMDLCALYESKDNVLFQKMIKHLMENNPRLKAELQDYIPLLKNKFMELSHTVDHLIIQSQSAKFWNINEFQEFLSFQLDTIFSLYKLLKVYPSLGRDFLCHPNFVNSFAVSYEINTRQWGKVVAHLEELGDRVNLCRVGMLRLFRAVVAYPTILSVETANDKRLDEFFDYFSSCIDEKVFIHDYEKAFPFRSDMQALLSRGIFVDETRIDYMANAISSCFHACGEEYAVEKLVVDPLYDPNFDRQLLGACSLDITGVALDSLITQVKDLLPELPNSYIEAVLKHYGYSSETTINALLEGSVPSRLEKYKNEEYIRSQSTVSTPGDSEDLVKDKLPASLHETESVVIETERFIAGRNDTLSSIGGRKNKGEKAELEKFLESDKEVVKAAALSALQTFAESAKLQAVSGRKRDTYTEEDDNIRNSYIDNALLPTYDNSAEYDDEYDDTYDDLGAGMTEPDNDFNPLNRKKVELMGSIKEASPDDQDDEPNDKGGSRNFDQFCEDPAAVRERNERRRQEMHSRSGGRNYQQQQQQHPQGHDVVGRAKGQGQEKDVVYNRRQKTANKGAGGSWKKRSDNKRKEF